MKNKGWTHGKDIHNAQGKAIRHSLSAKGIKNKAVTMLHKTSKVPAVPKPDPEQERIKDLAEETGFSEEFIKKFEAEHGEIKKVYDSAFSYGKGIEAGDGEYLVFESDDDAEKEAIDQVTQDLEDNPEMFTQDWLQQFIIMSDTDRRITAGEQADFRLEDLNDDEIVEEAGMKDEYDELQEKIDSIEDDDAAVSKLEKEQEKIVDDAKEKLHDQIYDEWYEGLEDPVQFLVEEQGIYSREDLLKQNFVSIDIDAAAQEAVDTDGIAHFLATYDGDETKLDGHYVYRTN